VRDVRLRQGTHNNLGENVIRLFVVGLCNWLFADTPAGAADSLSIAVGSDKRTAFGPRPQFVAASSNMAAPAEAWSR
jgi:hypothetical protein